MKLFIPKIKPTGKSKCIHRPVRDEASAVLRDAGLTAVWVEGESISFKLIYLIAYPLSYKPT
jgi:hypothetical protein